MHAYAETPCPCTQGCARMHGRLVCAACRHLHVLFVSEAVSSQHQRHWLSCVQGSIECTQGPGCVADNRSSACCHSSSVLVGWYESELVGVMSRCSSSSSIVASCSTVCAVHHEACLSAAFVDGARCTVTSRLDLLQTYCNIVRQLQAAVVLHFLCSASTPLLPLLATIGTSAGASVISRFLNQCQAGFQSLRG
jgi:hypothetical protein